MRVQYVIPSSPMTDGESALRANMAISLPVGIILIQVPFCNCYHLSAFLDHCNRQKHIKYWGFVGVLQKRKYENAMTLDKSSWGYRAEARLDDFLTIEELIKGNRQLVHRVVKTISTIANDPHALRNGID